MNILDVHQYLAETFLPGITITDPVALSIARAYKMVPDVQHTLAELPCVMVTGHTLERSAFKPAWIQQEFAVQMDLFVRKSSVEQGMAAEISAAFQHAIAIKLSDTQKLGGTVSVIRGLRSELMPARLEWAGVSYTGATLLLDVTLTTSKEHAA